MALNVSGWPYRTMATRGSWKKLKLGRSSKALHFMIFFAIVSASQGAGESTTLMAA
ncbi:hypothetical protein BDD12DRAFT_824872 [Trichophaea hybrida]|nr:hypothetical protein BDD12DRAFT_824872 [Trichophaea hybrida]